MESCNGSFCPVYGFKLERTFIIRDTRHARHENRILTTGA